MEPSAQNTEDDPWEKDGVIFIDETGESLAFVLFLKDFEQIKKTEKVIEDRLGVVKKRKEIGNHEVVLVEDNCLKWQYPGDGYKDVFKVSYIEDCIKNKKLLNISDYRHNVDSDLRDDFNYMDIFYGKLFTWNSVPDKYKKTEQSAERSTADRLLMDSSDEEGSVRESTRDCDKRTRTLFSVSEKRAMIDYIFKKHKAFDQLKGNLYWKQMEQANICPIRTWQSMKNHFMKSLVYNLRPYDIPKKDFDEFKQWYFAKSHKLYGSKLY
nr:PREDICTED: uncharacterized protein LOC109043097 isoform X2 [Bemisia tabaci]